VATTIARSLLIETGWTSKGLVSGQHKFPMGRIGRGGAHCPRGIHPHRPLETILCGACYLWSRFIMAHLGAGIRPPRCHVPLTVLHALLSYDGIRNRVIRFLALVISFRLARKYVPGTGFLATLASGLGVHSCYMYFNPSWSPHTFRRLFGATFFWYWGARVRRARGCNGGPWGARGLW